MPRDPFLGIPLLLYSPTLAFLLLGIALIAIPRDAIKRLFLESLLWGFVLSFLVAVLARALNLFHYAHHGPFTLAGSPIWFNFAWSPAILIFLHFKPKMNQPFPFWSYVLAFALMSAALNETLFRLGLLVHVHWSSWARFFVGIGWFYAVGFFHERYFGRIQTVNPRGD